LLALRANPVQFAQRDSGRMTNDILQSDIDLARKLVDDRRPSDEIVAALSYRGIGGSRAAQLVADLQAGKIIEPDRPISINLPSRTRANPAAEPEKQTSTSAQADFTAERGSSRSTRHKANPFPWFKIIALTSAAVCITVFVLLSRKAHSNALANQRASQGTDPSIADAGRGKQSTGSGLNPKAISVEVDPEGVRLCGNSVKRQNFLASIFKTLGAPTRTNQADKADHIIYGYDSCGLLVYV